MRKKKFALQGGVVVGGLLQGGGCRGRKKKVPEKISKKKLALIGL